MPSPPHIPPEWLNDDPSDSEQYISHTRSRKRARRAAALLRAAQSSSPPSRGSHTPPGLPPRPWNPGFALHDTAHPSRVALRRAPPLHDDDRLAVSDSEGETPASPRTTAALHARPFGGGAIKRTRPTEGAESEAEVGPPMTPEAGRARLSEAGPSGVPENVVQEADSPAVQERASTSLLTYGGLDLMTYYKSPYKAKDVTSPARDATPVQTPDAPVQTLDVPVQKPDATALCVPGVEDATPEGGDLRTYYSAKRPSADRLTAAATKGSKGKEAESRDRDAKTRVLPSRASPLRSSGR